MDAVLQHKCGSVACIDVFVSRRVIRIKKRVNLALKYTLCKFTTICYARQLEAEPSYITKPPHFVIQGVSLVSKLMSF